MKVAGFGTVPSTWDPEKSTLTWQTNRRLRLPSCQVLVSWKDLEGEAPEKPLRWSFRIDQEATYVPRD